MYGTIQSNSDMHAGELNKGLYMVREERGERERQKQIDRGRKTEIETERGVTERGEGARNREGKRGESETQTEERKG